MKPLQKDIYQLLQEFDAFCKANALEYFLMYGTLLGAVREQRFIPWDDDIDVSMDMANFNRLRELSRQGKLPATLRFEDTHYNRGCSVPKIRSTASRLMEKNGGVGLFLDIFPLRRYTATEMTWMRRAQAALHFRNRRKAIRNPIGKALFRLIAMGPHLFFIMVRAIMKRRSEPTGNHLFMGHSPAVTADAYLPADAVFPLSEATFETLRFPIPGNPDKVLTIWYGSDWRIPKQWANADHFVPADSAAEHI